MNTSGKAALVSILTLVGTQAQAEGWFWQNAARVYAEQNDNIHLSTTNVVDAASVGVAAESSISLESEDARAAITPRVEFRQYSSDQDLDYGSARLDADLMKIYERTALGLKASGGRDTTLTSEVEDSGNLRTKVDRNRFNVAPFIRYKMTPLSGIKLGGSYQMVDYVDGEAQGYFDYDQSRADLAYELDLTRRDLLSATAFIADYRSDSLDNKTQTIGLELGLEHKFSENTSGSVSAGGYTLESEFTSGNTLFEDTSNGALFRLQLNHNAPLNRYIVGVSSSLEPSSLGILRRSLRLDASVNHSFTPRLSGTLSGLMLRNESTDDRYTNDDRDYYSINTSLAWHLDALWRLRAGYQYASQQYDVNEDAANASRVSVSIEYNSLKYNF